MALGATLLWAALGPVFHFSNTRQLAINTGTTIVTVLMVFLLQNSQTRDAEAIKIRLDERLSIQKRANKSLLELEDLDEQDLHSIQKRYEAKAETAQQQKKGQRSVT